MSNNETTTVNQQDINIDDLLGTPGAENIMVPEKEDKKPGMFSRSSKVDLTFLDKKDEDETKPSGEKKDGDSDSAAAPKITAEESNKALDNLLTGDEGTSDNEDTTKKGGRPSNLEELGKRLIEKGYLTPFEGEEDVSKYTLKDWEELFDSNENAKKQKFGQEASTEFYENLPEELQVAAHYVANGGNDLKSLFRSLAAVEEIRQLDTSSEENQEQIVRSYLHATQFGSAEDIEEEIEGWKDRNELENKANKFKPKLDAMQEQIVARQLQQQEAKRKQQQQQAAVYTDNVYKTLEPGEINGLKVDKKIQNLLFSGLTQANYPSVSGKATNLLGHLLEKYQYVEPNHALISEALWLLADPEGYRAKVKAVGSKDQVEKTVRTLKTEQSNKITSNSQPEDDNASRKKSSNPGLARPTGSFFKR